MSEKVETFDKAGQILAVLCDCSCEDFHFVNRALRGNGKRRKFWFCFRRADEGVSRELQTLYYVSEKGEVEQVPIAPKRQDQQAG